MLFGLALLCCGLSSTVTATLAGQAVMEGFLDIRLPAWLRRLITRAIAIMPGGRRHADLRRGRDGQAVDLESSHPQSAAALRDRAAGPIHGRSRQDGRSGRPALAGRLGRRDCRHHHCAQSQAVVAPVRWLIGAGAVNVLCEPRAPTSRSWAQEPRVPSPGLGIGAAAEDRNRAPP